MAKQEKKNWKRKIIVFLTLIAIIGSGVYIYNNLSVAKAYTIFAPIGLGDAASSTVAAIHSAAKKFKQAIGLKNQLENMGDVASSEKSNISKTFGEETQNIKDKTFNAIKGGLDFGMNAIGKFIGVDIPPAVKSIAPNNNCKY